MKCMKAFHRPHTSRPRPMRFRALATAGVLDALATMAHAAGVPQFTSALDDSPLEINLLPDEKITDSVQKFYDTGEDPYKGDAPALADILILYEYCRQACLPPNGSAGPR